jgi:hypothetical protein
MVKPPVVMRKNHVNSLQDKELGDFYYSSFKIKIY